jgi:uncharacterized protein
VTANFLQTSDTPDVKLQKVVTRQPDNHDNHDNFPLNILIYLAHPAQYHFYKFIVRDLQRNGHTVKMVIKSKDILETLLQEDGVPYENILPEGRKGKNSGMFLSMLKRDVRLLIIARKFKPDILLGSDSCTAHIGWFIGKPSISFGEDDFAIIKKLAWAMLPFTSVIISPGVCKMGPFINKKVPFEGYMKLAYLHPHVFTPDRNVISGFSTGKFCIIRTAKLSAHHDGQIRGLDKTILEKLIPALESKGMTIFMDAENPMEESFTKYAIKLPKNQFHQLIAFAELVISDSQSLSVEAAILGVPSIRFNDFAGKISVLEELEHTYGLTFGISPDDPEKLFLKLKELMDMKDRNAEFQQRRKKMLSEKIDVKAYIVWFIENYPESRNQIMKNPQLQFQFKSEEYAI